MTKQEFDKIYKMLTAYNDPESQKLGLAFLKLDKEFIELNHLNVDFLKDSVLKPYLGPNDKIRWIDVPYCFIGNNRAVPLKYNLPSLIFTENE